MTKKSRRAGAYLATIVMVAAVAAAPYPAAALNPEIEMMEVGSLATYGIPYKWAYFRNVGHPCGKNDGASAANGDLQGTSDAFATFLYLFPSGVPHSQPTPLYVHSHGGLIGAFSATNSYPGTPHHAYTPGGSGGESRLDQEHSNQLLFISEQTVPEVAGLPILSAGLLAELRSSGNDFRFLLMSMCDHDAYSGEGAFDEAADGFNPYDVDSSGDPIERRADGLTTSIEALKFVAAQVGISHLFLGGTSAGSIGSLALGFKLESLGLSATGIIADSHVDSLEMEDITAEGCYVFTTAHMNTIKDKVHGPGLWPGTSADRTASIGQNQLPNTPVLHIWDQNDVGGDACPNPGGPGGTFGDPGLEQLYANDWHHIRLAQAITANKGLGNPAHDASHNVWLCVQDPIETERPCAEHSLTKYTVGNSVGHRTIINPDLPDYAADVAADYGIDYVNPVDYPSTGDGDYNRWIMDWIQRRIDGVPEP
ncbi:MAG: hypothetical protein QF570_12610 [Myxococcota bacterium]|jgi:hypothetical protein|nr:hypothetical protein [Myxococcota bacterium]